MELFATAVAVFEAIVWIVSILVAVVFIAALARGTIEDIRDHRRIVAGRVASGLSSPPSAWESRVRTALTLLLRRNQV